MMIRAIAKRVFVIVLSERDVVARVGGQEVRPSCADMPSGKAPAGGPLKLSKEKWSR